MPTIKIKFRPSTVQDKKGTLFYQIIPERVVRQITTGYKLFPHEWNNHSAEIILPPGDDSRKEYLLTIKEKVEKKTLRMEKAIATLQRKKQSFTADDVVTAYLTIEKKDTLFSFMKNVIDELKSIGKIRTSETYTTTLNSFIRFQEGEDVPLNEINSTLIIAYETYLRNEDICPNSSSFYLRNLRAVYNRAVERGLTPQQYPFKHVYTGIDKTIKRAVSLKVIRQIKDFKSTRSPSEEYSRDLFLFSLYTRGMSFVDIAFLKKKDLNNGILSYRRKKTKRRLFIRWEKCMQEIIDKYSTVDSPYLFPIIRQPHIEERKQYINAAHLVNRKLKEIGKRLKLPIPLTMYVARHSWASIAKSKNISLSIISEGMGHDSESTTQIYLTSLDTTTIDRANRLILKSI